MKHSDFKKRLITDTDYTEAVDSLKLKFSLGDVVIRGRIKNGWSQSELARIIGTKQANISRIESGLANPTIELVQRIMRALDTEIVFVMTASTTSYKKFIFPETPIPVPDWPVNYEESTNSQGTMPIFGTRS